MGRDANVPRKAVSIWNYVCMVIQVGPSELSKSVYSIIEPISEVRVKLNTYWWTYDGANISVSLPLRIRLICRPIVMISVMFYPLETIFQHTSSRRIGEYYSRVKFLICDYTILDVV